jgi:hypothetical protein
MGLWKMEVLHNCQVDLFVNDLHGERKKIKRCEVWDAQETVGIHLALDGNIVQQAMKMKTLATNWADHMRTGKITRDEVWLALSTTIMRTLSYPLPALNLAKKQCEDIMRPLLMHGLPAMGICRPRDLVFAPALYMGIFFKHLYTLQEIARIKDIILHTHSSTTTTGELY